MDESELVQNSPRIRLRFEAIKVGAAAGHYMNQRTGGIDEGPGKKRIRRGRITVRDKSEIWKSKMDRESKGQQRGDEEEKGIRETGDEIGDQRGKGRRREEAASRQSPENRRKSPPTLHTGPLGIRRTWLM